MPDNSEIDGFVKRGQIELPKQASEFINSGYTVSTGDLDLIEPSGPNVREFEYRGHKVSIATHYEIKIDDQPWQQHIDVLQNGTVHYHGLPQANLPSAVDLIKVVIDTGFEAPSDIRDHKGG